MKKTLAVIALILTALVLGVLILLFQMQGEWIPKVIAIFVIDCGALFLVVILAKRKGSAYFSVLALAIFIGSTLFLILFVLHSLGEQCYIDPALGADGGLCDIQYTFSAAWGLMWPGMFAPPYLFLVLNPLISLVTLFLGLKTKFFSSVVE